MILSAYVIRTILMKINRTCYPKGSYTKRDISIIYQGLYREQIARYSSLIKSHITNIKFMELFTVIYPDGIVTQSRMRAVIAYLVYGISSTYTGLKEEQIIPQTDTCIPIHKTLNQLARYFEQFYLTFDSTLNFHKIMENLIVDDAKVFTNKNMPTTTPMIQYNNIENLIVHLPNKDIISNIRTYVRLLSSLVDLGFEIVDLNDRLVRLFVYIPGEVAMTSTDINSIRRSAIDIKSINEYADQKVLIYYPLDNDELDNIIHNMNRDIRKGKLGNSPIIIAQIRSIFPTYDYNGTDLELNDSLLLELIRVGPTIIKYVILNKSNELHYSEYYEYSEKYSHPYQHILLDAISVFDFVKDSGLAKIGTIEIQLEKSMTIIAPSIMTEYENFDLYPVLKLKLIDPICYPYSFYRIYMMLKCNKKDILRIRQNPMMMSLLNDLNLVDLYAMKKTKTETEISHPIFSEFVKVILTHQSDNYVDSDQLQTILAMRSKVIIKKLNIIRCR